ncbi:MAG TPA: ANTAR domain-containing protein [Baekduia sp.]|uniref:ANTAR domain-containing response regulator n=1 Tax=Baekduia sp. TaxID=2600305 RepID=UPI002CAB1A93|nr:ANTAR domain-containing protein [Baekduia sp.]HMJ35253.1 ANTAR domain-containing protein [Baekduia sp.]
MNTPADGLRILAADEDQEALERTARMLGRLGHDVTATAVDLAQVTEAVAREDPELSVVVVHHDDEHALDLIEEITAFAAGPVIALLNEEDHDFVRRAAERGLYAAVRDGDPEAVQSAIEVALSRHAENARLGEQIVRLESALERRALIERAKGILMERHGIGDRTAFDRIRAHARSNNRTVLDVAAAVTDGHALLSDGQRHE